VAALMAGAGGGRLAAQGAPPITVVGTSAFRSTAVMTPHLGFLVLVDSAAGGLALSDLTIPPVTFSGTVTIEGIQPGARAPETRPFADTVRFDGDGRVTLLVADRAGRPPMVVETFGSRSAAAGRLVVSAPGWPLERALLVTIEPADLYEQHWRSAGYGVRDRIRVDDRRNIAFFADPTIQNMVVAVGLGRGVRGRIQTDATTIVLLHEFGEAVGRERRTVGKLVLAIDPVRDAAGTAHADILFGLGASEEDAVQAMQIGAAEPPLPAVAPPSLRVVTPSPDVGVLLAHVLNAARPMLDWDRIAGVRALPSAADDPTVRAADAWFTAQVALHLGLSGAACPEYGLFKQNADAAGRPPTALAHRLAARGGYLWTGDSTAGTAAEAAAGQLLRGFLCYRATRDSTWIAAEGTALRRLAGESEEAPPFGAAELDLAAAALAPPVDTGAAAWRWLAGTAHEGIRTSYGRLPAGPERSGLSLRAAGALLDLIGRGLFGIDERLDHIDVAPHIDGINDSHPWRLDGWPLAGDSLGISYRPADRAVTIRIGALTRRRLVLRFPWLAPGSCVTARRGVQPAETLPLVAMADGSAYVDVRGAWDPAEIAVTARACPR
jgi:hypothetical protein